jgi:penicillin-binding protein 1A
LFVVAPAVLAIGVFATLVFAYETINIPSVPPLKQTTYLYDRNGHLITTLFRGQDRTAIPLSDMPKHLRQAVLAVEDAGFYHHGAISPVSIVRAAWADLTHGSYVQGGSTITQQYVKIVYTGSERSLFRKIKEAILAIKLEHKYSKNQILQKYLNTVYFGQGAYGVQSAAQTYFGVDAKDLTLTQDATLAGAIAAPSRFDPIVHPVHAKARRDYVLQRMADVGDISQKRADRLGLQPLKTIRETHRVVRSAYFVEYARRWLEQRYGDATYDGGLRVRTSLDLKMENAAQQAINAHLSSPHDPWATLVAIDPRTGEVRALAGRPTIKLGQFDPAIDAHRQTGSAFKAFTLTAAFQQHISPFSYWNGPPEITIPSPECYTNGQPWKLSNYADESAGTMSLLSATANSVNTIFAQLVVALHDGPQDVVDVAHKMGIRSHLSPVCSITLGTQDVTPLEMTDAYATLAARGIRRYPVPVEEIKGPNGKVIRDTHHPGVRAVQQNVSDAVTYALQGVVRSGTGTAAYFGRPVAGKTGTGENFTNAWFCGYVPQLVACVWVGYPQQTKELLNIDGFPEVFGGSIPAEIWHDFMASATAGMPVKDFTMPSFAELTQHPRQSVASPAPPPPPPPSPAPSPSPSPSPKPSPSPSPKPSPPPSPSPPPTPTPTASSQTGTGTRSR